MPNRVSCPRPASLTMSSMRLSTCGRARGRAPSINSLPTILARELVAHHALTVHSRYSSASEWQDFFPQMERCPDDLLAIQEADFDAFRQDYGIVALGDRWSLVFCYGWQEPNLLAGYQATLHRPESSKRQTDATIEVGSLEIAPDPFDGAIVQLDLPAKRIPARRYTSDDDLRHTLETAPIVRLIGTASGPAAGSKF
jgi:hypothetical protein